MKIRCLIVDDEPLAVRLIENYVKQIPGLELAATCSSAVEAFTELVHQPVQLIFLDIKMPKLLGTDFIRSLSNPPKVIIISAYREYAMDGYELGIVDYLLKPVSFARFRQAVGRAEKLLSTENKMENNTAAPGKENDVSFFYFKVDREMKKVMLNQIMFIESRREYVILFLEGGKKLMVKHSIASLEKLLSPHRFARVHRSFIVTTEKITSYNASRLKIGETDIPVGRTYKMNLERRLLK